MASSFAHGGGERARLDDYLVSRQVIDDKPLAVLVDAFRFVDQCRLTIETAWGLSGPARLVYFLSHFHSDHYVGLSPSVARACGVVYASRPTAALLVSQRGIPRENVCAMDFGVRYCFSRLTGQLLTPCPPPHSGSSSPADNEDDQPVMLPAGVGEKDIFYVQLIPANHCPGAAMFLFTARAFGTILHTGDFRFNGSEARWRSAVQHSGGYLTAPSPPIGSEEPSAAPQPLVPFYETFLEDVPALRRVAGHVDTLFLDNTFCDPAFRFISQWQATQGTVGTLRGLYEECLREKEAAEGGAAEADVLTVSCALLVGTYSIGKERVAFAVQEAFPRVCKGGGGGSAAFVPVHVTRQKYRVMQDMHFHVDRFLPMASHDEGKSPLAVPALAPSSLAGDEQTPLSDKDEEDTDMGTSAATAASTDALTEALPLAYEVHLPERVGASSHGAGAGTGTATPPRRGHVRFLLTILLVPLKSTTYPPIAAASGRALKHLRNGGTARTASALLDIGEGLGLDLARYDRVLAVEPTGWARRAKTQRVTDRSWLFKIPYSEHCAFHEMLSFVGFVNPKKVIPTVSFEQFKRHESLFAERAPRLASRWANTQPLTRFFTITKKGAKTSDGGAVVKREEGGPPGCGGSGEHNEPTQQTLPSTVEAKACNPFAPPRAQKEKGYRQNKDTVVSKENEPHREPRNSDAVMSYSSHSFPQQRPTKRQIPATVTADDDGVVIVAVTHVTVNISDSDEDGEETR